ncbi:MAG: ABC transporter ATP-binding protein/permease [Bacteroidales bacterium]|nr:ABC transporter ATP-binding protein/permease [Bacteroidales bacterium]
MKKFFKSLLRYRGNIALNIVFNVLYVLTSALSITMIVPFVSVLFGMVPPVETPPEFSLNVDSVLQNAYYYVGQYQQRHSTMGALAVLSLAFVAVTCITNVFRYLSLFFLCNLRSALLRDMRTSFYSHMMTLPLGYFSEKRKGDLLSRINSDVGEVEYGVARSLQGAVMEPLFVIVFVAGLFMINWQLSLVVLAVFPPMMYVAGKVGASLKKKSKRVQEMLGEMVSRVEESINGLRIIKSFNLIALSEKSFAEQNVRYVKALNGVLRRRDLAGPLTEMMLILVALGVMLFGGIKVMGGGLNADMFVLFVLLLIKTISPAKHAVAAFYDIQKGRAALERIYAVLREPSGEGPEEADRLHKHTFEKEIRYEDVSFHYEGSDKDVVDHVNLALEKGKTYAFVGASGAGKTTTADLLSRFYEVSSGRVTMDGVDIRQIRRDDLRELVGTVSQFPFVWRDTVAANIAFGLGNVSREQIEKAAKQAFAHDFIMQLPQGYDTVLGDNGMNLSGGQRQRIVIARAILKNAPILVLDEATSALDTESEIKVQQALEKLMQGRTSVVIAHRISTIRNADCIVVFEDGKIIEQGTHSQLMEKGRSYAKYVNLQTL